MYYELPTSVTIDGEEYDIRTDFRVILDIFAVLADPELTKQEKAWATLQIFYPDYDQIPRFAQREALQACFDFISMGERDTEHNGPRLVDWERDFPLIAAPINRVLGYEIRAVPYDRERNEGGLHWYTFLAAYYEIGDCTFAQVVRIRDKLARHRPLDKQDKQWYRANRRLVDIPMQYTDSEQKLLAEWGGA